MLHTLAFLKGDTYGVVVVRKLAVPIYLVERLEFDYMRREGAKG